MSKMEKKIEEAKAEMTAIEEPVVEAEETAEPIEEKPVKKASKEVKAEKPSDGHLIIKTVTASLLNVRKGPDVTSPVKMVIEKGSKVKIKSIKDGWAELVTGGYVMTNYIE